MEQTEPMLKTVKQGAKILNVSTFSLYKKIKNGQIPAFKFGRKVLVDIDAVLAAMRVP